MGSVINSCTQNIKVEEGYWIGGLAGLHQKGIIKNCSANGTITSNRAIDSNMGGLGGLVSRCEANVLNCFASTKINCKPTEAHYDDYILVGGLIAELTYSDVNYKGVVRIEQCYAVSDIELEYDFNGDFHADVGGLVGISVKEANIQNCYTSINITSSVGTL